jgi:AraC-like DNA-binding protein
MLEQHFSSTWKAQSQWLEFKAGAVEVVCSSCTAKREFTFSGAQTYLAIGLAGSRSRGETHAGGYRSTHRAFDGCVVAVPPGERLSGWSQPDSNSIWLNIYLDEAFQTGDAAITPASLIGKPGILHDYHGITTVGSRLKNLVGAGSAHSRLHAQAIVTQLLFEINYQLESADKARIPMPLSIHHRRERVEAYIDRNLSKDISLADLAQTAGLSISAFLRNFRAYYGVTPHRYIIQRRILLARRLVSQSRLSMTEIALEAGFSNPSHFSTVFRHETGMTPVDYRRKTVGI